MFGQCGDERVGQIRSIRRAGEEVVAPAEHTAEDRERIGDASVLVVARELRERGLDVDGALTIDDDAVFDQDGRGHDEAHLADLAEPLSMRLQLGRNLHPVIGHRYTRPTGSKRMALTS